MLIGNVRSILLVPSPNKIIIAAAGGGKTTRIVGQALGNSNDRAAILTYTRNNTQEIERKVYELNAYVPEHIEIHSWFSFLIRELARPYQNVLYERRIDGLNWVEGRSDPYAKQLNTARFYFGNGTLVYSDKVAQFICECNKISKGAVIRRLEQRFNHIYIDEVQDMAGYDIDLIELILKSDIKLGAGID